MGQSVQGSVCVLDSEAYLKAHNRVATLDQSLEYVSRRAEFWPLAFSGFLLFPATILFFKWAASVVEILVPSCSFGQRVHNICDH